MQEKLIINGTIYDGEGNPPFLGDIRIHGDKITEIGFCLKRTGEEELFDAKGLAVTPGFIDMHRHCDKKPFEKESSGDDYGDVMLRQGITTTVTGNCGISMYPLSSDADTAEQMRNYYAPVLGEIGGYADITDYATYVKRLQKCRLPVNTASMIGMGAVRIAVKGFSDAPFTKEEIQMCRNIIEDALKRGAAGVSIGLMYLPECYEMVQELGEILKPVGKYGRIVTAHIRGEGDSLVKSVEEAVKIGRLAGCSVEISHFKSCGIQNWKKEIFRAIECIEKARSEGQSVACDFYPYDCGSTTLLSMIPPEFMKGNLSEMLVELNTVSGRQRLREMLKQNFEGWDNYALSLGWDKVILSSAFDSENREMIGKSILQIAKKWGCADETEAVARLLVSEHGTVAAIIRSMEQNDIDTIARLPYSCVISDAIYAQTDRPHPRMYGAFPKIIREYVKERGVLTLPEAVRKMSGLPAERMNIAWRGKLKEGYFADVNVFSPEQFRDVADYLTPTQTAVGLKYCFINGAVAVKEDIVLDNGNGRMVLL